MFELPLETPWIWIWLATAALIGLLLGWLFGRRGKKALGRDRAHLTADRDEAIDALTTAEDATSDSGVLVTELQQQVDDGQTSLADADREISRLRSEVDNDGTRIIQLEASLRAAEEGTHDETESLRTYLAAAEEKGETLRTALSAATVDSDARVAAAESDAQEALGRVAAAESDAQEALGRVAAAESDAQEAFGRVAAAESALSVAERERDTLAERLVDVHNAAQAEAADLHNALEAAEAAATDAMSGSGDSGDGEEIALLTGRLAEAEAQLETARAQADANSDGDAAARDHLLREFQTRVAELSDIEDRLMARDVELEESRRTHDALVAARDAEIRGLHERIESLDSVLATGPLEVPDPATAAELEATRAELAVMQERALYWESESAGLRADLAARSSIDGGDGDLTEAPTPTSDTAAESDMEGLASSAQFVVDVDPDAGRLGERLAEVHDVLADKEARIAYLADRVARLESRATVVAHPPTPDPVPDPVPDPPAQPDDLTAIWGIGPAIQAQLNQAGITTYDQVTRLQPGDIAQLGDRLGTFLDRIDADDWMGQARGFVEERGGTIPDTPMEPIRLAPPAEPVLPDDLTRIRGIGPFIHETLAGLGITTFAQVASWTAEDVSEVGEALVIFQGRIERERWVDQARELLSHP